MEERGNITVRNAQREDQRVAFGDLGLDKAFRVEGDRTVYIKAYARAGRGLPHTVIVLSPGGCVSLLSPFPAALLVTPVDLTVEVSE